MRLRLLVRRVTLTGTAWAAALAVAVLVCAVGAAAAHSASGPACIHDSIVAEQLGSRTLDEALAEGRFRAHGVVEVPRAGLSRAATTDDNWRPLRVAVYAEDVRDPTKSCSEIGQMRSNFRGEVIRCTAADVFTTDKIDLLLNMMLPQAIKMHQDRLSVQPLANITIGTSLSGDICGSFSAPAEVQANGVRDADFVLFVAVAPVRGDAVAWAATCGYGDDYRPFIGAINIKPRYIDGTDEAIRVMAHELMHALGFEDSLFRRRGMVKNVTALRGGPDAPVIASDQVVQRVGNHYNCSVVHGMELDRTGVPGTAGSHWNLRNAKDEMMCGYVGAVMKYTAISIAAMEDLGYYRGNYSNAEHMEWGFNAGCGLLNDKCVKEDVSQFPSMFCTELILAPWIPRCTSDRLGIGGCDVTESRRPIPPYFQYFSDPWLGGSVLADYCPYVNGIRSGTCSNGNGWIMELALVGPGSRCVDLAAGSSLEAPLCVGIECDASAQTYSMTFLNASSPVTCPEGAIIDAADSSPETFARGSTIVCPPYGSVCPATFNSLAIRVNDNSTPPTPTSTPSSSSTATAPPSSSTTTAPSPANTTTPPIVPTRPATPGDGSARLWTAFPGAVGAVLLTLAAFAL